MSGAKLAGLARLGAGQREARLATTTDGGGGGESRETAAARSRLGAASPGALHLLARTRPTTVGEAAEVLDGEGEAWLTDAAAASAAHPPFAPCPAGAAPVPASCVRGVRQPALGTAFDELPAPAAPAPPPAMAGAGAAAASAERLYCPAESRSLEVRPGVIDLTADD